MATGMNPMLAQLLAAGEAQKKRYEGSPYSTMSSPVVESPTGDLQFSPEGAIAGLMGAAQTPAPGQEQSLEDVRYARESTTALLKEFVDNANIFMPDPKKMNPIQRHFYKVRMALNPWEKTEMMQKAATLRLSAVSQLSDRVRLLSEQERVLGGNPVMEAGAKAALEKYGKGLADDMQIEMRVDAAIAGGAIPQENRARAIAEMRGVPMQTEARQLKEIQDWTDLIKDGASSAFITDPRKRALYDKMAEGVKKRQDTEFAQRKELKAIQSPEERQADFIKEMMLGAEKRQRSDTSWARMTRLNADGDPVEQLVEVPNHTIDYYQKLHVQDILKVDPDNEEAKKYLEQSEESGAPDIEELIRTATDVLMKQTGEIGAGDADEGDDAEAD